MPANPPIVVYRINRETRKMERLAYLENAYNIGYELKYNDVSTCRFSIPMTDPKCKYLEPTSLIELWDNGDKVGLFKVGTRKRVKNKTGVIMEITCRHVISTLSAKVMFGYNEFSGRPLREVIADILSTPEGQGGPAKQTDWMLDRCDFGDLVLDYSFENTTLYDALMTIPRNWTSEYQWAYNTDIYPWRLSLIKPSATLKSEIRQGKNLLEVDIDEDWRQLCNKVYALGSGEGVNQVNLVGAEDLEQATAPKCNEYYVEDEASAQKYGETYEQIYVDRSIERPPLLLQAAKKALKEYANDHPTYTVKAADIYSQTRMPQDHFAVGDMCRVVDDELQISIRGRILSIEKSDVIDKPWDVRLEIAHSPYNLYNVLDDLKRANAVTAANAQGATNIWTLSIGDNADASHPIKVTLRLPDDLVYVNNCVLDFTVERFRAYEKGAASGGQITTADGGGETTSSRALTTTETTRVDVESTDEFVELSAYTSSIPLGGTETSEQIPKSQGYHVHVTGTSSHFHLVKMTPHKHGITIPAHSHPIAAHQHTAPIHKHKISPHSHDLIYGIFEEPTLAVAGTKIYVDGILIGNYGTSTDGIDIVRWLRKDKDGKVVRGKHTVEIYPSPSGNSQALCRISGSVFVKCFVRSRGEYAI